MINLELTRITHIAFHFTVGIFWQGAKYTVKRKKLCFEKVFLPVAYINCKELHRLSTSGQQVGPVSKPNFLEIFWNRSIFGALHMNLHSQLGMWILWLPVKAVFLQNNIFSKVINALLRHPPLEVQFSSISATLLNPPLPWWKIKTIITR